MVQLAWIGSTVAFAQRRIPAPPTRSQQRPGLVAGFGARNRLFEVGWLKFPSLMTAVWAAEHLVYMRQLTAKLAGGRVEGFGLPGVVVVCESRAGDMGVQHGC